MFKGDARSSKENKKKVKGVEPHRARANQMAQWRIDSAQNRQHIRFDDDGNIIEEKSDTESSSKRGKHTRFSDDGTMVTEDAMQVPPDVLYNYRRQSHTTLQCDGINVPDWKKSKTVQDTKFAIEIIKEKVKHEEFYVTHHTFSKARLEAINSMLTDIQRDQLAKRLGISLSKVNQALSNLYSNLSIGPFYRTDDPSDGLDATYYQVEGHSDLKMDPRSEPYCIINQFIRRRSKTEGFPDDEFTENILKPLEKAEKIHVVLTKGYHINPEVSMWKKVPNNYRWKKVPIQISKDAWKQMQADIENYVKDDISLFELKNIFSNIETHHGT